MRLIQPSSLLLDEASEQLEAFKKDVLLGLSQKNKAIPSKYFYDKKGSELFNRITKHPDYYLTNCELDILRHYKTELSQLFQNVEFNLIELGPGEGIKTRLLLKQFVDDGLNFTYMPIDISGAYLRSLSETLLKKIPHLNISAINSDYFTGLKWLSVSSKKRNIILFLGSSIGNLGSTATQIFLKDIWNLLHAGDFILIGFDLRKDIQVLLSAYNDHDGITREFNLNLLSRLNHELGANFNRSLFEHYPTYNPKLSAMESYLISKVAQIVRIDALNKSFTFDMYEAIHVEYSYKYTLSQIKDFARKTGFKIIQTFLDDKHYFADSLWQKTK